MAYFWNDLERFSEETAFIDDEGVSLTYRNLLSIADLSVRHHRGLLLIEADNSVAAMATYVGALRRSIPVILVNAGDDAAAARIIETFDPAGHWTPAGGLRTLGAGAATHPDLAVMLSTSGSTGTTKLVRLSATAVDANARSIVEYLGIDPSDRAITTLPPAYSYGLSIVNSHLAAGAAIILNDASVIDARFRATIDRHGATSFGGVPYTYELLGRSGLLDDLPRSLRTMTQAGGRLQPDLVRSVAAATHATGCRFFVMYGQTEATARMAYLPPELLADHADCIGRAIPGGELTLVDEDGAVADRGELVYTGPNVMMGYAETAADLAKDAGPPRLPTGDLAERSGPGLFRITGRKSRFIKIFGLRIALDEVERISARLGWTLTATGTDEQLVLAMREGDDDEAARTAIAGELGIPAHNIVAVTFAELPRLESGKTDYQSIIRTAATAAAARPDAAGTGIEPIRAFYRGMAPHAPIDGTTSFIGLSGDSLNYVQAGLVVENALGFLPADWETLTLDQLATLAAGKEDRKPAAMIETNVLLRAAAIGGVVGGHASHLPIGGGSGLLMLLAGYSLFRFQGAALLDGRVWRTIGAYFLRIAIPYLLATGFYLAWKRTFDWKILLMVSNFAEPGGTPSIFPEWFVQVLLQSIIVIGVIFSVPALRLAARRTPFRFAFGLTGGIEVLRVVIPLIWNTNAIYNRVPWFYLPLICLALLIVSARTPRQRIVTTAMIGLHVLIEQEFGSRAIWLLVGAVTLTWMARVYFPRSLRIVPLVIASAVFYIYLLHMTFIHVASAVTGSAIPVVNFLAGMAGPVFVWWLVDRSQWRHRLSDLIRKPAP